MEHSDLNKFKGKTSLRQIEIVFSVYRTLSITKTASDLGMTVGNVSRTCSRFNDHFEFEIFSYRRRGVVFSERGIEVMKSLSPLAEEILKLDRL